MKTEAQLARTELELLSVDEALNMVHYFYKPKQDSWKDYCRELGYKLSNALHVREYRAQHDS